MDRKIYAVLLTSESGLEIPHAGHGSDGLRDCQALAQRLTETKQGAAMVGIFQPLTKQEQREIIKWNTSTKKTCTTLKLVR